MRTRPRFLLAATLLVLAGCTPEGSPGVAAPDDAGFIGAASNGACTLDVPDAEAYLHLDALLAEIDALEASGALNAGQARALRNHLGSARRHIEEGNYCPALDQLVAFRDHVEEFVDDGILTEQQAGPLSSGANDIIDGPPAPPNQVIIDAPSPAAGTYGASDAAFGPALTPAGVPGQVVLADDGSGTTSDGCEPFVAFPAGAIALVDRGQCTFTVKAANAQAAGAVALIVANNLAGQAFTLGGSDPSIVIPAVMITLADGATIRAGLPASGAVRSTS